MAVHGPAVVRDMLCVVAPVFHKNVTGVDVEAAVSVADGTEQVNTPDTLIVVVGTVVFVVITT